MKVFLKLNHYVSKVMQENKEPCQYLLMPAVPVLSNHRMYCIDYYLPLISQSIVI